MVAPTMGRLVAREGQAPPYEMGNKKEDAYQCILL